MALQAATDQVAHSLATMPATKRDRQAAFLVIALAVVTFGAVIPFANVGLPRVDSFIPALAAIIFVTDIVIAVLLFSQFAATGSRALLLLASGYLYSSLSVIPYALTFPGAFTPTGLLGAGPQSAAWLQINWRLGLALALLGYALLTAYGQKKESSELSREAAIARSVTVVILTVGLLTWVAVGDRFLPDLIGPGRILPLGRILNGTIALTHVITAVLLYRRGKSVLDLWLMVAACGMAAEAVLVTFFISARFTLGFYANRVITLVVSKVVLVVLLSETVLLQARLAFANTHLQRERENKLMTAEAVVAALAHEVRQPLTSMGASAGAGKRFLDQTPPDVAEAKGRFQRLEADAFRANDVFENWLGLFREGNRESQPVDMNALAQEAAGLLRTAMSDDRIVAYMNLDSQLGAVQGNRGQLREVILNLLQNAIEAMSATTTLRTIRISTARRDSRSISVAIEDTGPGIDPDRLESVFDPFVTTKAKGTGLGLAICKMIIEQHGGTLSAASSPDRGALFEITLPVKITETVHNNIVI